MNKGEMKINFDFLDNYTDYVFQNINSSGKTLRACLQYINRRITEHGVWVDEEKTRRACELIERYFNFTLMPWEKYVLALVHCYTVENEPVFRKFVIVMGTGNGKNGFLSGLIWYLTTPDHGLNDYNIEIIANSEDQARTSFDEIYEMLERNWVKLNKTFTKTKTAIRNKMTGSIVKYNTSNAKTKAGKRAACLVFDEVFGYENYDMIGEFQASFGKKEHSRIFIITSQGNVREGVLDNELAIVDSVLDNQADDLRLCPLIYTMDDIEEVKNPDMWEKANPSINYLPNLRSAIEVDFTESKFNTSLEETFYTKRMNYPRENQELTVATREEMILASREIEYELDGLTCVAGVDYALLSDMASAGLLFRVGDERIWIQHSWICKNSADWGRIKAPLTEWQRRGDLTIVNDVMIPPQIITEWLVQQSFRYNINTLGIDTARFQLLRESLEQAGFVYNKNHGNIKMVRPLEIASVSPVIDSWFKIGQIIWGDIPLMRWATNNTKKVRMTSVGASGNYKYDKIEPKSRKNDPFMALVHASVVDEKLSSSMNDDLWVLDMPAIIG